MYFPDSDFLQATVPASASATWSAIVAGRVALEGGLIKRIGDGRSTMIWSNKWIPGLQSMMPSVHIGTDGPNSVADLIDGENQTWKIDLVRRNFTAPDADAILNITLCRAEGEVF